MLREISRTEGHLTLCVARVVAGVVICAHGAQKLGWLGGPGLEASLADLAARGLHKAVAVLVIAATTIGAVGLLLGFLGRLCALANMLVMGGGIWLVHRAHGFYMNWSGTQLGEGIEYHVLMLGLLSITLIGGSGALSIDWALAGRQRR